MNAALAVALAAVALGAAPQFNPPSTPDAQIGLVKGEPSEVLPPPAVKENDSAPGERPVRPRPFPGAAPAIPHGIDDFLPITKAQNACVDCHAAGQGAKAPSSGAAAKKGDPTPLPPSHFVDLRNAPGTRQEKVAGARWVCTACHVPQQDVAPLVKSPFPH